MAVTFGRFLALLLALACLVFCGRMGATTQEIIPRAIAFFVILLFIWFADEVGSVRGFIGGRPGYVDRETPGRVIAVLAWLALIVYGAIAIKPFLPR
jgi:uncharacterized membrane protein YoaT (DUF817 family)